MKSEGSRVFTRYAAAAALAMALGPLTALTVASVNEGTAGPGFVSAVASPGSTVTGVAGASGDYSGKSLSDVAASSGSLDFFSSVLSASQIKDMLRGDEQFTVFIPVNAAFSDLGGDRLSTLLNDPAQVQALAKAHVVPGKITVPEMMTGKQMKALNGDAVNVQAGAGLTVNGASIIGSETAENGIVHYVDRLL